jgi:hypothetical protein
VLHNTQRYVNLFYAAADALMPSSAAPFSSDNFNPGAVLQAHRIQRVEATMAEQAAQVAAAGGAAAAAGLPDLKDMFPPELLRNYEIQITPAANSKPTQLRQIKAKDVSASEEQFMSACVVVTMEGSLHF